MARSYDEILNEFKKELEENDKLVNKEINKKNRQDMSKEFVEFVGKNNCKIASNSKNKGGKNGK